MIDGHGCVGSVCVNFVHHHPLSSFMWHTRQHPCGQAIRAEGPGTTEGAAEQPEQVHERAKEGGGEGGSAAGAFAAHGAGCGWQRQAGCQWKGEGQCHFNPLPPCRLAPPPTPPPHQNIQTQAVLGF